MGTHTACANSERQSGWESTWSLKGPIFLIYVLSPRKIWKLPNIVPVHWSGLWETEQFLQAEHPVLEICFLCYLHEHKLELKRWWRMNSLTLDHPFSGKCSKPQGTKYVLSETFYSSLSPIQRFAMLVAVINLIELQFVSAWFYWLSQLCQKCLVP